jgi:hypothetical protein
MTADRETITAINLVIAALFLPLLILGTGLTIARAVRTIRQKRPIPVVLKRDLVSRTCLTIPIAAIVLVRVFGITGLGDNILWVAGTGILFVVSVGTYAFFEVFVIERPRYYERQHADGGSEQGDRIELAIAENTRISQGARDDAARRQ